MLTDFISNNIYYFKILGVIVILIIVLKLILMYRSYLRRNPVFYKNGKDGKKADNIDDIYLVYNNNFTYSFFIYIDDWNYNIYKPKVILGKSNSDFSEYSFLIGLREVVNDLFIKLKTSSGEVITSVVDNFPLKKWTSVTFIYYSKLVEIYIDGKLYKSIVLNDSLSNNKFPLLICPEGGFSGYISKLRYSDRVLSYKEIYNNSLSPLFDYNIIRYTFNTITPKNIDICGDKFDLDELSTIDKDQLLKMSNLIDSNDTSLTSISKDFVNNLFSKVNEYNKEVNQIRDKSCPNKHDAPKCPIGTLACNIDDKYCYYPEKNIMVSTFINNTTDSCPTNNKIGNNDGSKPFLIDNISVWKRQNGADVEKCQNLALFSQK
jgi:hypothetical protein